MHSDKNSDRVKFGRTLDGQSALDQTLDEGLRSELNYDYGPTTDIDHLRTRLTTRSASQQLKKRTIMGRMYNQISKMNRRSRLTVTAAVAALALFTLVPFSYQDTIGYEVAFAGVDKEIALDKQKLHEILEQLGVEGAVVDVFDCEETCHLRITDLKTAHEAQLVRVAFGGSKNVRLLYAGEENSYGVKVLVELKSGNLLDRAKNIFFAAGADEHDVASFGELHEIVLKKLGHDFDPDQSVWVRKFEVEDGGVSLNIKIAKGHDAKFFSQNGQPVESFFFKSKEGSLGMGKLDLASLFDEDGNLSLDLIDGESSGIFKILCMGADGNKMECLPGGWSLDGFSLADFMDGELSDEDIAQLQEKGYEVEITENEDGSRVISLHKVVDDKDVSAFEDDPFADPLDKDTPSALPEGYELSQNYPNPFNPTTRINYTIPAAEHVTIEIVNVMGQIVRTLVDETVSAGQHVVEWDSRSDAGVAVSSGMYFYRFRAGSLVETKKMTLLK